MIYGIPTGPIADLGGDVQHLHSIVLPIFIKAGLGRGQAAVVGEGKNIWPSVEIGESELFLFYFIFYNICIHANEPLHFRSHQLQICISSYTTPSYRTPPRPMDAKVTTLARTANTRCTRHAKPSLKRCLPVVKDRLWSRLRSLRKSIKRTHWSVPFLFVHGSCQKINCVPCLIQLIFFGTNCRCRADRSRSIGWKPVKTTKDMLASIQPEVDTVLDSALTE
jgi:hypothetical protein